MVRDIRGARVTWFDDADREPPYGRSGVIVEVGSQYGRWSLLVLRDDGTLVDVMAMNSTLRVYVDTGEGAPGQR